MRAIYPGSFDPLTLGHYDIVERASAMCESLCVAISTNIKKTPLFSVEERVDMARVALTSFKNVNVEAFDGLLAEYVDKINANYVIRGLRAVSDFEFEFQMALMNRTLNKKVETIFMMPSQKYIFLSSTMIKDVASHGGDVSKFVTPNVNEALKKKFWNAFTE